MRVTSDTKNATRRRILEQAKKLFAEQGFEATTTRDIACRSQIAVGTLFNYFPTKESIVACLVGDACIQDPPARPDAANAIEGNSVSDGERAGPSLTLEEELFAHVAAELRKLKPYRKYLPVILETSLSPLSRDSVHEQLRLAHLDTVGHIVATHGHHDALSSVALQLYWTLYSGVLAFWAKDTSPRQEDTLALLDESLAMFVGWLVTQSAQSSSVSPESFTKGG